MRPEPETRVAFLPSKGYNFRRATKHFYVYSQNLILPSLEHGGQPSNGIAHMYRCEDTGTVRRWGFEPAERKFFLGGRRVPTDN